MNLPWKIKLIDDLVREDPDTTIKDYLALIGDLENLEHEVNTTDMGSRKGVSNLTIDQKKQLVKMINQGVSIDRVCKIMGICKNTVYTSCRCGDENIKGLRHPGTSAPPELLAGPPPKIVRPKAEYSNRSPFGIATEFNQAI